MSAADLTVAVLVEHAGRFLIIEETAAGQRVLTQPGGHLEDGESPEAAAQRETAEEAGLDVAIREMIGAYLWHEECGRQCVRIVFLASLCGTAEPAPADPAIHAAYWLTYAELVARQEDLRSPSVLRCIDDYLAGERQPRSLFANCDEPDAQIDMALANAQLLTV